MSEAGADSRLTTVPAVPNHETPQDAMLILQPDVLLEYLRGLLRCASLAELQQQVDVLRSAVLQPDNAIHAAVDGTELTFPRGYFLGELEQIAASQTIERGRYYVERFIRGATEERQSPINDLNLNRWKEYSDILTDSLWHVERRDSSGAHTASYWGNYIPQIPYQMMRRYTRKGDWVLDPFAGSGTTLLEAQRLGRHAIGIELQAAIAEQSRQRIASEPNRFDTHSAIHQGDSATINLREILAAQGREAVQLVMLHPPYFDIIRFSDDPADLSNAADVDHFLSMIGQVVDNVAPLLERGRYLVLVIGDKYARGEWIPLGFLTMQAIQERGFTLKSMVVKNFEETTGKRAQKELWRYRALAGGFYVFKHEYLFIMRKR